MQVAMMDETNETSRRDVFTLSGENSFELPFVPISCLSKASHFQSMLEIRFVRLSKLTFKAPLWMKLARIPGENSLLLQERIRLKIRSRWFLDVFQPVGFGVSWDQEGGPNPLTVQRTSI